LRELSPASVQPPLPRDQLLLEESPDEESVPLDVLFVGGGPAGLAGAIRLAQRVEVDRETGGPLADLEIGVLEKSSELGEHCLSGAVVNPEALKALYPDMSLNDFPLRQAVTTERVYLLTKNSKIRLPTPPTMKNHGNYVASLCEIVRWLGGKAEELGVNVFTGFPAASLLSNSGRVNGVRTTASGLDRDGVADTGHMPPMDISARVTVLAEGTRGPLSQAWLESQEVGSDNPQIFALGVKELWKVCRPIGAVTHTLGWPLPRNAFGGSFIYPMSDELVALGLVVGLDAPYADLDVHDLLQAFKGHPLVARMIDGGELVEWGAKTIPEGGYHAIPHRLSGDGLVLTGDAAGFVDVAALKGIHYAMRSGIFAADTIYDALVDGDTSAEALSGYDIKIRSSLKKDALYRTRNMRLAFKKGFFSGGLRAGLMQLTHGSFPSGRIPSAEDASYPRIHKLGIAPVYDGQKTFSKLDGVFRSGNATRDDIPSHLIVGSEISAEMASLYERLCPAGVYERDGDRLVVKAPNCIDCKATDVIGPRWTPREGGSGPSYKRM